MTALSCCSCLCTSPGLAYGSVAGSSSQTDSQSPQQAVVPLTRGSTSSASTDDVAAAACSEVACACAARAGLAPAVAEAACPPMLLPPPADATAGRFTRGSTTAGYRQAGSRVGLQ